LAPQHEVRERIALVRRRWILQVRLSALGPWMACAATALVLGVLVVRIGNVQGFTFVLLIAASTILALGALGAAILRMRRPPADRQVARFIEERVAALTGDVSLNDGIVSAVEIAESGACSGAGSTPLCSPKPRADSATSIPAASLPTGRCGQPCGRREPVLCS